MGKDYRKTAEEVLQYIGGKDNIEQAAHCVTRLRIALKDESKIDNDKLQSVSYTPTNPTVNKSPIWRVTGPIIPNANTPVTTIVVIGTTNNWIAFGTCFFKKISTLLNTNAATTTGKICPWYPTFSIWNSPKILKYSIFWPSKPVAAFP